MDNNAVNAMLAHQARAGDDNSFVRSIIESYVFIGFGVVTKYEDEHIDVSCGNTNYTNVEVVVFGVDGWGVKVVPAVDDRVMLFSSQVPVSSLKEFTANGSMPAYDRSGLKAVPITDSSSAQLITVNKDGISITGSTQLTVDANGFSLTDAKGNTLVGNDDGITLNGNLQVLRS